MNLVPRFKELQPLRALVNVGATTGPLKAGQVHSLPREPEQTAFDTKNTDLWDPLGMKSGEFRTNPWIFFGGGRLKQANFKNLSLGNCLIRKSLGPSWEMLNHQTTSLSESERSKTDHDRHPEYYGFVLSLSKKLRPGVQMQSSKWQWKIPYQYVYIMYVYIIIYIYSINGGL